jgi:hypothetical protein
MLFVSEELIGYAIAVIGLVLCFVYLWFRIGPRRCPNCGKRAWGRFGKRWVPRRIQYHCKECGQDFQSRCRLGRSRNTKAGRRANRKSSTRLLDLILAGPVVGGDLLGSLLPPRHYHRSADLPNHGCHDKENTENATPSSLGERTDSCYKQEHGAKSADSRQQEESHNGEQHRHHCRSQSKQAIHAASPQEMTCPRITNNMTLETRLQMILHELPLGCEARDTNAQGRSVFQNGMYVGVAVVLPPPRNAANPRGGSATATPTLRRTDRPCTNATGHRQADPFLLTQIPQDPAYRSPQLAVDRLLGDFEMKTT